MRDVTLVNCEIMKNWQKLSDSLSLCHVFSSWGRKNEKFKANALGEKSIGKVEREQETSFFLFLEAKLKLFFFDVQCSTKSHKESQLLFTVITEDISYEFQKLQMDMESFYTKKSSSALVSIISSFSCIQFRGSIIHIVKRANKNPKKSIRFSASSANSFCHYNILLRKLIF